MKLLLSTLADWLGGTRVLSGFELEDILPFQCRLVVDSRQIKPGDIFVCIKGQHQDGHDFYQQAIQQGAQGIITERILPISQPGVFQIHTDATTEALKRLGFQVLQHIKPKTIGITGSAGKTTVRSMLEAVFNTTFSCFGTLKNFNTPVGVPLSLAQMPDKTEYFMCELSASYPGEITETLSFIQLDHAIITGIGPSHLAFFHDEEGVFREKLQIANQLKSKHFLWMNGDQKWAKTARNLYPQLKTFGLSSDNDYSARSVQWNSQGMSFQFFRGDHFLQDMPLRGWGLHLVRDALVVLAIALNEEISLINLNQGLGNFFPEAGRGRILHLGESTFLLDESYNANPYSMLATLDALLNVPFSRKIMVLGDMLELGENALTCHQELGTYLSAYPHSLDAVIYVGEFGAVVEKEMEQRNEKFYKARDWKSALAFLLQQNLTDRLVLVKASNGVGLHQLVSEMENSLK